jgi:hypothetical protein
MTDTDAIEQAASCLEMLGTSRANFHQLSTSERRAVGKVVVIQLNRKSVGGSHQRREEQHFFHLTGKSGIKFKEAATIWREITTGDTTMDDIYNTDDGS